MDLVPSRCGALSITPRDKSIIQFKTTPVLGELQQPSLHRSTLPLEPVRACTGSHNRSLLSQRTASLALGRGTEIILRNPVEIDSALYVEQRLAYRWPSNKVFDC